MLLSYKKYALESCNYIFKANLFIYQNESLDIRNEIEGSNGIEENDFW